MEKKNIEVKITTDDFQELESLLNNLFDDFRVNKTITLTKEDSECKAIIDKSVLQENEITTSDFAKAFMDDNRRWNAIPIDETTISFSLRPEKKEKENTEYADGGNVSSNVNPVNLISEGFFFENNEGKILGEKFETSLRYKKSGSKKAINYRGDVSVLDKIEIRPKFAKMVNEVEIIATEQECNDCEEYNIDDLSNEEIERLIAEAKGDIATKIINEEEEIGEAEDYFKSEDILTFEETFNYEDKRKDINPADKKLNNITEYELKGFVYYFENIDRPLSQKWYKLIGIKRGEFTDELIKECLLNGGLYYFKGKLIAAYRYLSGDLYVRKHVLNQEAETIKEKWGEEVLQRQQKDLDDAFKQVYNNRLLLNADKVNNEGKTMNKLLLNPLSEFCKSVKIKELEDGVGFYMPMMTVKGEKKPAWDRSIEMYSPSINTNRNHIEEFNLRDAFLFWLIFYQSEYQIKKRNVTIQSIKDYFLYRKRYNAKRDRNKVAYKIKTSINRSEGLRLFDEFLSNHISVSDRVRIETIWNQKYNNYQLINYDKIPVAFSCTRKELNGEPIEFRFEKREAVAFAFGEGTGLLAYQVGVGKTRSAILTLAQYMEAGFSKRPLIVVPNQTYTQWINELSHLLPQYAINGLYNLSSNFIEKTKTVGRWVDKKTGSPLNENYIWEKLIVGEDGTTKVKMYGRTPLTSQPLTDVARWNETKKVSPYTITVMTYEGMAKLGFVESTTETLKTTLINILTQESLTGSSDDVKKIARIEEKVGTALAGAEVNIEDLGIDYFVMDEAHAAKKLFTSVKAPKNSNSKYDITSGTMSNRAIKAFTVSQYIQSHNNGNNTLYLTATPFTNSPLEIYSMLALVSYHKLRGQANVNNIHSFFDLFVIMENKDVVTNRMTIEKRDIFVGFNNLYPLQQLIQRFMNYKEGEKLYPKNRIIKMVRPNKHILPLTTRRNKNGVPITLPLKEQVRTDMEMTKMQKLMMSQVIYYMEYALAEAKGLLQPNQQPYRLEHLKADAMLIAESMSLTLEKNKEKKEKTFEYFSKAELEKLSINELLMVATAYGLDVDKIRGAGKQELISIILANEPVEDEEQTTDNEAVEVTESDIEEIEDVETKKANKAAIAILRGINYSRSLTLSPMYYIQSVLDVKITNLTPELLVETSPKIKYTMECVRSVKQYHENKGKFVSGQVIYMDRGKDYFNLLKKYLVQEIGFKDHEVSIIKSGMNKKKAQDSFLGREFDEATGKFFDIPHEKRTKILIGSSSIREGMNLQKYTSVGYNLYLDWNPTDFVQFVGRFHRQGNIFDDVRIVVPLLAQSIDVFMFQKLQEKITRINSIWNFDGRTSILKADEFDPEELKYQLIRDAKLLAGLEAEKIVDKLEDNIMLENNKKENLGMLLKAYGLVENSSLLNDIKEIVDRHRGKKERSDDAYLAAYNRLLKNPPVNEFGDKVSIRDFTYHWEWNRLKIAVRTIKRLKNGVLLQGKEVTPESIKAEITAIEKYVNEIKEEIKQYDEKWIEKRAEEIKEERNLAEINLSVDYVDRVKDFKKLNHLLDNYTLPPLVKKTKQLYATCEVLDKNGNRKTDAASIKKLDKCLQKLPSTRQLFSTSGIYFPERQKLHKQIIQKVRAGKVCIKRQKPIAILTAGLPASGKSTFLKKYAKYMLSDKIFHIDSDAIKEYIPEYKGWNAPLVQSEVNDIIKVLLKDLQEGQPCNYDVLYDGTMKNAERYIPLINNLNNLGYDIFVIFMEIPVEVAKKRMLNRYKTKGRYVPVWLISEETLQKSRETFDVIKENIKGYVVVDGVTQEVIERGGIAPPRERNYFGEMGDNECADCHEGQDVKVKQEVETKEADNDEDIIQMRIDAFKIMLDYEDDPEEIESIKSMIESLELAKSYDDNEYKDGGEVISNTTPAQKEVRSFIFRQRYRIGKLEDKIKSKSAKQKINNIVNKDDSYSALIKSIKQKKYLYVDGSKTKGYYSLINIKKGERGEIIKNSTPIPIENETFVKKLQEQIDVRLDDKTTNKQIDLINRYLLKGKKHYLIPLTKMKNKGFFDSKDVFVGNSNNITIDSDGSVFYNHSRVRFVYPFNRRNKSTATADELFKEIKEGKTYSLSKTMILKKKLDELKESDTAKYYRFVNKLRKFINTVPEKEINKFRFLKSHYEKKRNRMASGGTIEQPPQIKIFQGEKYKLLKSNLTKAELNKHKREKDLYIYRSSLRKNGKYSLYYKEK